MQYDRMRDRMSGFRMKESEGTYLLELCFTLRDDRPSPVNDSDDE